MNGFAGPRHMTFVFAEGMRTRTGFQSPKVREVLQLEEAALALKIVLSIHRIMVRVARYK